MKMLIASFTLFISLPSLGANYFYCDSLVENSHILSKCFKTDAVEAGLEAQKYCHDKWAKNLSAKAPGFSTLSSTKIGCNSKRKEHVKRFKKIGLIEINVVGEYDNSVFINGLEETVKKSSMVLSEVTGNSGAVEDCPEAKDHKKLVDQCRDVGVKKVISQAESLGHKIKKEEVYVNEIDGGVLTSYVWFCAKNKSGTEDICQITQKSVFKDCF